MEPAGVALGVVGLLVQTFESALKCYKLITGVQGYSEKFAAVWSAFENQREHFISWGERQGLLGQEWHPSDPTPEQRLVQRYGARRVERIKATLAQIKELLMEAERVGGKYGLQKVKLGRKVAWKLDREVEFEALVRQLKRFNSDLAKFTSVEVEQAQVARQASTGIGIHAIGGVGQDIWSTSKTDPNINMIRQMRFAAHDFDMLLDDSRHFSSPNIGLLLKLQPNRFVMDEKEVTLQKIPEWLELQLRYRPRSSKFAITIIPQVFDQGKENGKMGEQEGKEKSTTTATSTSTDPKRRSRLPEVKLLFESIEPIDGKRSTNVGLKHIAEGLEKLNRSQSQSCPHCLDVSSHIAGTGFCLGGFRGLARNMNHFVYQIPTMPHAAQKAVSLEELLPGGKYASILPKAPVPSKRVRLVSLLALSFLQLYETPWFPVDFSTSDIYFSVLTDGSLKPSINQPFLRRRTDAQYSRAVLKTRELLTRTPSPSLDRRDSSDSGVGGIRVGVGGSRSNSTSDLPPSTKATDFDDAAFYLGLVIFQILTWLPREERIALVTEAKRTRNALRNRLPSYQSATTATSSTAAPAAGLSGQDEFGAWMKKSGLLKHLKDVLSSSRYINAVRLCLLGGFGRAAPQEAGKEGLPPAYTSRRAGKDLGGGYGSGGLSGEAEVDVKVMEEDFWGKVVAVLTDSG